MIGLELEQLQVVWYLLLGLLLAGYAVLDGFDLGVGILHLVVPRDDRERRIIVNSIGPIWDGNEVWLVTFGGALFAAFPEAYATVFSAFYEALMLVLVGLILRAVSIEFRGKVHAPGWRRLWDFGFGLGSALATFIFGVAVGNAMQGIALDQRHEFTGHLVDLLGPYPIVVGLLALTVFAMHGAIFLYLKTEGDLQRRLVTWMWRSFGFFLVVFFVTTVFTLDRVPHATANFADQPLLWLIPGLMILALANVPRSIFQSKPGRAFASSCLLVICLVGLLGATVFPDLVTSTVAPATNSLTVHNASSSAKTLDIMLLIALIGMPFVVGYTAFVYWTFRGKVVIDDHSY
ncbi:MAG: cytochrome d ubiquinol oxidase subunit II [Planctomycetes bacterium]|nr:cytochrome d ubiquinol oxidase subunit II [Planctomycetota bacterium]